MTGPVFGYYKVTCFLCGEEVNGYTHVCPNMFHFNRPLDIAVTKRAPTYAELASTIKDTIDLLSDIREDMHETENLRYEEEIAKHIDKLLDLGL